MYGVVLANGCCELQPLEAASGAREAPVERPETADQSLAEEASIIEIASSIFNSTFKWREVTGPHMLDWMVLLRTPTTARTTSNNQLAEHLEFN
jgi:hypothetical protein